MVFGIAASIFALAFFFEAELPFARFCVAAWSLSLSFLALRGFFIEPRDAFAPINQQFANGVVAALIVAGVSGFILEGAGPGVGLLLLAYFWMFGSDWWSAKLQALFGTVVIDSEGRISQRLPVPLIVVILLGIAMVVIDVFFGGG